MSYELREHAEYGYKEVTPTPTPEEITRYYSDEFYATEKPEKVNDSSLAVQQRDRKYYQGLRQDIYDIIQKKLGPGSHTLFDFGCGWCETLAFFQEKGFECFGTDPVPEAIEHGTEQGLNVVVTDMATLNPFDRRFEVVLMQNVLEHLADPENIVTRVRDELLVDGGLLIIDVPNEFNPFQEAANEIHGLGEWWVAPPAHLNYFSPQSLSALLKGKGFYIVEELASFPLEMFLLMGRQYVGNGEVGRQCHVDRMTFEESLRESGRTDVLHRFYRCLAKENLGRQILMVASKGDGR